MSKKKNSTDILFINPPSVDYDSRKKPKFFLNTSFFPPIGIAYLSSFLEEHGIKTEIIDMDVEKFGISKIPKIIDNFNPKVIGVSIISDLIFPISFQTIKKIKEIKDIPIVVGGIFPTNNPEFLINKPQIDMVVKGEGEQTLLELMRCLLFKEVKLKDIKGITYKVNGKIIHNPHRELIKNLDEIPFPRWIKFSIKKYFISIAYNNPSFAITASRGCPYRCIFCCTSVFEHYRIRSPKNVVDEIELLIKNYNVKDITFHDPTFNINPKWVIAFCKEILKRKIEIKWRCLCRVDNINEKMIAYMKAAGCYNIAFGIESSQDKFLEFLQKDFMIEQVIKAIEIVKKYRIEILAHFIYGIWGQNISDLEHNIKFIKKLNPDYISILILTPLTGTKLYNLAIKKRLLLNDNLELLDHPEQIGFQKQLLKIPYLNEEILTYYIKRTYLMYFFSIKTIFKYSVRYLKRPLRLLNAIKNIIQRFT